MKSRDLIAAIQAIVDNNDEGERLPCVITATVNGREIELSISDVSELKCSVDLGIDCGPFALVQAPSPWVNIVTKPLTMVDVLRGKNGVQHRDQMGWKMKASELIARLQELIEEHGDADVVTHDAEWGEYDQIYDAENVSDTLNADPDSPPFCIYSCPMPCRALPVALK